MGTVAERQTKGREAACTASRPLAYVCRCMCAPGSCPRELELSQGAVSMFSAAGVRLHRQHSCSYQP